MPAHRRSAVRAFDYTAAIREVAVDVCATLPELAHIRLDEVLFTVSQARQKSTHGQYACCIPLRFEGGELETVAHGRRYRMPIVQSRGGKEMLYLLCFTLPRYHDEQDYHEKLATLIHELYHISPRFNGDIRRFPGKNFAHGQSRELYHQAMRRLATRYLSTSPRAKDHDFMRQTFRELQEAHGGVVGSTVQKPRPFLVQP